MEIKLDTAQSGLAEIEIGVISKLIRAAINSVEPGYLIQAVLSQEQDLLRIGKEGIDLRRYEKIFVISVGKAALQMAKPLVSFLPRHRSRGLIVLKTFENNDLIGIPDNYQVIQGDHPIPGPRSVAAGGQVITFLKDVTSNDLVICLISGGGSALMVAPAGEITLKEIGEMTSLFLNAGANIQEINTVRKHIEVIKGGGLARIAHPARVVSLILSDVIGDPLDSIASGPTTFDRSTYNDALEILAKYKILSKVPERIRNYLLAGARGYYPETLKPGDEILRGVSNHILGNNYTAVKAVETQAQELGFSSTIMNLAISGEARLIGQDYSSKFVERIKEDSALMKSHCWIGGGETTVTVKGKGKGGRNLELALSAVRTLDGLEHAALFTLATDGEDSTTGAAGALVTGRTYSNGLKVGLDPEDYLKDNDSLTYFQQAGGLVFTGPTGTNVNDLLVLISF